MRSIRRALPNCPARRLIVAPDCGMKYLPREVAYGKMVAMVRGAGVRRSVLVFGVLLPGGIFWFFRRDTVRRPLAKTEPILRRLTLGRAKTQTREEIGMAHCAV